MMQREKNMTYKSEKNGERFLATVKQVRAEGVYVEKHGKWSGSISAKCWGNGEERVSAMSKIRPGNKLFVQVVSCNAENQYMSLVLAPEGNGALESERGVKVSCSKIRAKKPEFVSLPAGTCFLIDLANLMGELEVDRCAEWMRAIETTLINAGYGVNFFIEERSMWWAIRQQRTPEDGRELKSLCKRKELVTIVPGSREEADLAIMQTAFAIPNSVCVSCDKYRDYAKEYPNIVGTQRVRSFNTTNSCGRKILHIMGIHDPITLPERKVDHTHNAVAKERESAMIGTVMSGLMQGEKVARNDRKDQSFRFGTLQTGKDSSEDFFVEDICSDVAESSKQLSVSYDTLSSSTDKRQREIVLRDRRIHAQMRRLGTKKGFHLSAKKRRELKVADFCASHDEIRRYLRTRHGLKAAGF